MGINGKPTVGGSDGTWGTELNNVLDSLNPTTTTGDLIYAGSSSAGNGVPTRLAVGAASSVLTVGAASALQWTPNTGTGSVVYSSGASLNTSSIIVTGTASVTGLVTMANSASITGTLAVNASAIDTTPEIKVSTSSSNISVYTGLSGAAFNNLVTASDNAIIFYGTASNSGALTISPWASATTGIRITASNTIAITGSTTLSGGTASITGTASISSSAVIGGTASIAQSASVSASLTVGSTASVSSSLTVGGTASITGAASAAGLYSTSGSINGTLNATTLQQGGNAVPTITTTARMAQGIATGTTTASGILNIATGLTTVTNIIVSNGASGQAHLVSSASSYSGGNASVVVRTSNTGSALNAGAASVNWIAFGT